MRPRAILILVVGVLVLFGMVMLFSNSSLVSGTTYYIVTGGTITGGTEFHGYYTGATVSGGTTANTFTVTNILTTVN